MKKKRLFSLLTALALLCTLTVPALAADKYAGIETGSWYEAAARQAVDNGVMTGTDKGFEPEGLVTRGQVYQILYNLAGKPQVDAATPAASDLAGTWYADAVQWANDAGVRPGQPETAFLGGEAVTRAETASVLAAYAQSTGIVASATGTASVEKAPDYAAVPEGFREGVAFCYSTGLMVGDTDGNLTPTATLTRAQLAKVMENYAKLTPSYTERNVTVQNGDRAVVAVVTVPAGTGPFPAVVMNHGHGGSKDENVGFVGIARALALRGIASVRMDFPGCGESQASFTENCLSNMISDSNACKDYLLKNYPVDADHLGILGYSMGGRLSAMIANEKDSPYKALALLAGAVGDGKALVEGQVGGADMLAAAYEKAKTEGKFTLTTQYGQVLQLSQKWFDDMTSSTPLADAKNFNGPVLVMYGDKDTVVIPEMNQLSLSAYPQAVEVVVSGADHGYGFYSDQTNVTETVEGGISGFFAVSLCNKVSVDTLLNAPGMVNWFATGKQAYSISGMTVAQETAVHNDLEDANYTAKPGTDVVLTGTAKEQWVTPLEKVLKTYTKQDGSPLTAGDFTAGQAVALYAKAGTGNFATFVPKGLKVEVNTAWGDVLQANREGVPHGDGDYLVCSAGEDGTPDLSDIWVVNGSIFPATYAMPKK